MSLPSSRPRARWRTVLFVLAWVLAFLLVPLVVGIVNWGLIDAGRQPRSQALLPPQSVHLATPPQAATVARAETEDSR